MKSSKWSLASARSWKESSTSSRGSGVSTRCRVKAGTQRRVTAEIAPSAPIPTRAARSSSGSPAALSSRTRPSARTSSSALDLGGDVAQPRPGAVGAGRDRAGDRLAVDVAEVLHRQPEPAQLLVEVGEHRARPDLDQAGGAVGVDHAAERVDVDHRALGQRRLGEGVAGAGDADLAPGRGRGADRLGQLLAVARAQPSRPARRPGPRPSCARSARSLPRPLPKPCCAEPSPLSPRRCGPRAAPARGTRRRP